MRAALRFIDTLPEWSQSRKLLIVLITFFTMFLLALVGTALALAADTPLTLFERAMDYVFGGGTLGVGTQGVVDTVSARNGTYRSPVERTASTVTTPVQAPASSLTHTASVASISGFASGLSGVTHPPAENVSFRMPPSTLLVGTTDEP